MSEVKKIVFGVNVDKFSDFINKLEDLSKISPLLKIKIDNDNILFYSVLGKSSVLAFKNYIFNTRDLLNYDEDLDFTWDLVILEGGKFVKNLNFLKETPNIKMTLSGKVNTDDDNIIDVRSINFSGGKLKINLIGGEHYEIRDMTKQSLEKGLNLNNSKWSFNISESDFNDIKKLSSINGTKLLDISVDNGLVKVSEIPTWEMEVDNIDLDKDTNLILNKRFLNSIKKTGDVKFNIFDNFMLIKDEESNLMLSFEQDFSDEDV